MAAAAAQMIISCNAALELYVAPSQLGGSDQNPGTRQAPMASIQTARDFLRQIQKDTQFPPEGGASINLLPGDYLLTEILFNPYTPEQLKKIREELKYLLDLVESKNTGGLQDYLKKLRANLA